MSERQAMDLVKAAKDFGFAKATEWRSIVTLACGIKPVLNERAAKRLAEGSKIGRKTLKRKMESIQLAHASGLTVEQIVEAGQEKILKQFVKEKVKARTLPLVPFPHKLTVPVRDAFDASCRRVAKVLRLKTWDEVVDWINAQIELATDEEILHGAGEAQCSKQKLADLVSSPVFQSPPEAKSPENGAQSVERSTGSCSLTRGNSKYGARWST